MHYLKILLLCLPAVAAICGAQAGQRATSSMIVKFSVLPPPAHRRAGAVAQSFTRSASDRAGAVKFNLMRPWSSIRAGYE